ncbi:hypothetical protein [Priestia megaterium]|uniref:hypothetical protein n=1 Tax=Priestia megaterium TaxID=1404 RepID=UPI002E1D58D7|nr:hypothetical protein [Priestia megaterium]NGY75767.1 hypothetical protein [Priestia megaterium]
MSNKNIFLNNYMVLFLLLSSIFFYTYFYSHAVNEVSLVIDGIKEGMHISDGQLGILDSFYNIITSMYFQIPLKFLHSLMFVYGLSVCILVFNKFENKKRNLQQKDNSYSYIVSCFYKSIYVIILNYILQGTFLNVTGQSIQVFNAYVAYVYWLFFSILQFYVFSKEFYKVNVFSYTPIIISTFFIIIGSVIKIFLS